MSRSAKIILVGIGMLTLIAVLGVCAFHEKRPSPAPSQAEERTPAAANSTTPTATAAEPPPPLPPPVLAAPKRRRQADASKPLDEAALLAKINELGPSNLPLTLKLAREAIARFPDSPNAPEFAMNIAKSLLHMGRVEEARDEARLMLKKYPKSPFTLEVEHHLLRNPPNPR
jgi:tetratricopeptide (TPR) repeat protein